MKVKTAIDKVIKESMANMPKDVSKDILLNKKAMLNTVSDQALEWYKIYSDTKDVLELTKKMLLHPINEIQKNLRSLPFYDSI
jgi:CRISPR/Cas system-associated endonuclease Cas1